MNSPTVCWWLPPRQLVDGQLEPKGLELEGLLGWSWKSSYSIRHFLCAGTGSKQIYVCALRGQILVFYSPLGSPWRRKWQPTRVFLLGESQGRRSLVGCCLWGRTESDMLKQLSSSSSWQVPLVFKTSQESLSSQCLTPAPYMCPMLT